MKSLNKNLRAEENDEEHIQQRESLAMRYNSRGIRRVTLRVGEDNQFPSSLQYLRLDHLTKQRHICYQSIAYVIAFLTTVSASVFLVIMDFDYLNVPLQTANFLLAPLQGVFNLLIFLGFKVYFQKNQNPTADYGSILYSIFFKMTADPVFISRSRELDENNESKTGDLEMLSVGNLNLPRNNVATTLLRSDDIDSSESTRFPVNLPDAPLNLNSEAQGTDSMPNTRLLLETQDPGPTRNALLSLQAPPTADSQRNISFEQDENTSHQSGDVSYFTKDEQKVSDYEQGCMSNSSTVKR